MEHAENEIEQTGGPADLGSPLSRVTLGLQAGTTPAPMGASAYVELVGLKDGGLTASIGEVFA